MGYFLKSPVRSTARIRNGTDFVKLLSPQHLAVTEWMGKVADVFERHKVAELV